MGLCAVVSCLCSVRRCTGEPVFFFAVRSLLLLGRLKTSQADG